MAKPRGTIKRFRGNGKCRCGEKDHGAWRFIFTRQFRMQLRDLAARCARGLQDNRPITEGAGNAGCQLHPQPRVRSDKAHELVTTGSDGFTRHSPRNGFTAYFALSPVTTLFDTVACASYRRLDANDWGVRTTRLRRPRQHHSSSALPASTASRPTLMTCATPLLSGPDGAISELIWVGGKQKYFCKRGLTRF